MTGQQDLEHLVECELRDLGQLSKNTYLYRQGESSSCFYYVVSGLIGLYHMVDNGKESLIRLYDSSQYFGYRTMFSHCKTYHCSAKVLLSAHVICITPLSDTFLSKNQALTEHLLSSLADELASAESRLAHISYDRSVQRVFDAMAFLRGNYPDHPWSYREIAEFAGCETETAIRIARELKKEGKLPA